MGIYVDSFILTTIWLTSIWAVALGSHNEESGDYYGDHLGTLPDPESIGIAGEVYAVNDSCIQVIGFNYGGDAPDLFFWASPDEQLTSSGGFTLQTFEFGYSPLGPYNDVHRVVLVLPDDVKATDLGSFGLWCQKLNRDFGQIPLPTDLNPPKAHFLDGTVVGTRYNVGSGPLLVMDRRTIKVYGFKFDGSNAPDGYFYAGRGRKPKMSQGAKAIIRGRDTPDLITPMKKDYVGNEDIIIELPKDYDIYNLDWISIFCIKFKVDFGHIMVRNLTDRIPPYVPQQVKHESLPIEDAWEETTLLGRDSRRNFTFQLGPPGGYRGYLAMARQRPAKRVWYINGFMTPQLWLQRGTTYTFIIEGGNSQDRPEFNNPLYISNEEFGGYAKMEPEEQRQVEIYAGGMENSVIHSNDINAKIDSTAGRLCLWTEGDRNKNADQFSSFLEYKRTLLLNCDMGEPGVITFTPDRDTPDILYYQSLNNFNMGWQMMIVDEIPDNLPDVEEEHTYKYHIWLEHNLVTQIPIMPPSLYTSVESSSASNNQSAPSKFSLILLSLFLSLSSSIVLQKILCSR